MEGRWESWRIWEGISRGLCVEESLSSCTEYLKQPDHLLNLGRENEIKWSRKAMQNVLVRFIKTL